MRASILLLTFAIGCAAIELDGELTTEEGSEPTPDPNGTSTPNPTGTPSGSTVAVACEAGYEAETYVAAEITAPELWIVGAYRGEESEPETITVRITRTGDVNLVVSAFQSVEWIVELGAETKLKAVLLAGFNEQTVTGAPQTTLVYDLSGPGSPIADAYELGDEELEDLAALAEGATVAKWSGFGGCYAPAEFLIQ